MWFTFRVYGLSGVQKYIREHCIQAKQFEKLLLQDQRFELAAPTCMGLVCFRLKGSNELTNQLMDQINKQHAVFMISAKLKENVFIRFVICSAMTLEDLLFSLNEIQKAADVVTGVPDNSYKKLFPKLVTHNNTLDIEHDIKCMNKGPA